MQVGALSVPAEPLPFFAMTEVMGRLKATSRAMRAAMVRRAVMTVCSFMRAPGEAPKLL